MFDTYMSRNVQETTYCEKTVNIKEVKAPTDESVRLYGEFLDKAHKSILDSFIVKGAF